jgi:phosphatidylserine/phosphatidylglycerophosphate/cardiolipin synthase-like enzyme
MIAYASPDSTFAVTKKMFDSAKKTILIGIYDLTVDYMKELLLNAMARGVKVSLMLDLDGAKGENEIFAKLGELGAETVSAPSCANKQIHFFPNSHEKVIIIDNAWVMVQSGNYSANSIPFNTIDGGDPDNFVTGNRDMGVAIKSATLAKFFKTVLRADMALALSAPELAAHKPVPLPTLLEAAPPRQPVKLFPSKIFNPTAPIKITPVLSPDNYMDIVPDLLRSAEKSILIEQQYIRGGQDKVVQLLDAIPQGKGLDIRIILGKIFGVKDVAKEKENLKTLRDTYGLKLGDNVRYVDTSRLVHCHNKLIIVDGKRLLISSQNWSNFAVSQNREAGLILEYPQMARYFSGIFETDWETAKKKLPTPSVGEGGIEALTVTPTEVKKGRYIEVSAGDYAEV